MVVLYSSYTHSVFFCAFFMSSDAQRPVTVLVNGEYVEVIPEKI